MALYNKSVQRLEQLRKLPKSYLQDHAHKVNRYDIFRNPDQTNVILLEKRTRGAEPSHRLKKQDQAKVAEDFFQSMCSAEDQFKPASIIEITECFLETYLPCYVPEIHDPNIGISGASAIATESLGSVSNERASSRPKWNNGKFHRIAKELFVKPLAQQLMRLSQPEIPAARPVVLLVSNPYKIQEILPTLYEEQSVVTCHNDELAPWLQVKAYTDSYLVSQFSLKKHLEDKKFHSKQVYLSKAYCCQFVNLSTDISKIPSRQRWKVLGTPEKPITADDILELSKFIRTHKSKLLSLDPTIQIWNQPMFKSTLKLLTNQ